MAQVSKDRMPLSEQILDGPLNCWPNFGPPSPPIPAPLQPPYFSLHDIPVRFKEPRLSEGLPQLD